MTNQLSEVEIEKLFTFVKTKNVPYLDVQHEIVDHLATAIENRQENEANLNFEKALDQVYSEFPITGFAMMILSKEAAFKTYWDKNVLKFLIKKISVLSLFLIGGALWILYFFFLNVGNVNFWGIIFTLYLFHLSLNMYESKRGFNHHQMSKELFLSVNVFDQFREKMSYINLLLIFPVVFILESNNIGGFGSVQSLILAFCTGYIILWNIISTITLPKILMQEIKEKYNYLEFVKSEF